MSTVSTMFAHAISCQKVRITFLTQCADQCDVNHILENRFGLSPNPFFSIRIFKKYRIFHSSLLFYLQALILLLCKAKPTDVIYTRNSTFLPYLSVIKTFTGASTFFEAHGYHGNSESTILYLENLNACFSTQIFRYRPLNFLISSLSVYLFWHQM